MFKFLNDRDNFGFPIKYNQLKNDNFNEFPGGRAYYCGDISYIGSLVNDAGNYYIYNIWENDDNINFIKCKRVWCSNINRYDTYGSAFWFVDQNNKGYGAGFNDQIYWIGNGKNGNIPNFTSLSFSDNVQIKQFATCLYPKHNQYNNYNYKIGQCFAIATNGNLYRWGNQANNAPVYQSNVNIKIKDFCCGNYYNGNIILSQDGYVYIYDYNNNLTQIEIGEDNQKCQKIAASMQCFFVITQSGELYGWGKNSYGQIGIGSTDVINIPTKIGNNIKFKNVSAAGYHMTCQDVDGNIYGSGDNQYQQLLNSTDNKINTLTKIQDNLNQKFVKAGYSSTAIVDNIGSVYCRGYSYSTIRNSYYGNVSQWTKLANKKNVRDIVMGQRTFVILTEDF